MGAVMNLVFEEPNPCSAASYHWKGILKEVKAVKMAAILHLVVQSIHGLWRFSQVLRVLLVFEGIQ